MIVNNFLNTVIQFAIIVSFSDIYISQVV